LEELRLLVADIEFIRREHRKITWAKRKYNEGLEALESFDKDNRKGLPCSQKGSDCYWRSKA
jgi:prefoldin subunit 5